MAETRLVHVDVALELGGEAIRGTIDDATRAPVAFSGWLELMSAFDIVCARAAAAAPGAEPAAG
jgi:hypothetical protein